MAQWPSERLATWSLGNLATNVMGNLGFSELLVILAVALLVVGPKRLPQLAQAIGEAARAFRDALKGDASKDSGEHRDDQPGG